MKSKKAAEGIMWMIITIVLLLIFLFVYSGAWTKLFGAGISEIKGQTSEYGPGGDYDGDGVINLADKCPCQAGEIENNGCNSGYKPKENEDKTCLIKK